MDKTTQIKAEKAKQLTNPSKHLLRLLLPVPIFVVVGIMGNIQGWIGKPKEGANDDLGLAMTVPNAKVKDLEKDKKYGNYPVETPLTDVNGLGISFDDNSNINSKMLNGETGNSLGIASNTDKAVDNLTAEMGANTKRGSTVASNEVNLSSQQKKNRVWENSNAQQRGLNRNVNNTIDAMYRNPSLGREEQSGQDRTSIEERQRIQANEKLLNLLDKQIQQQGQMGIGTSVAQDRTPVSRRANSTTTTASHNVEPYHGATIGTNGREGGNSFYGLNGRKVRNTRPSKASSSIRAVVHGDGNGITVTNGSSVAIRMQEETVIGIEGEPLILPANTLVYGLSRINGDRIYITVSKIRMDNFIYNVQMEAYDLDGRKGLYVPDMNLKQRTNSSVVQGSTQLASPGYIVGGSVGQQVGGQLASQGVGMALNVGKNILTRKAQQPKAQIRPNYQILLRSETATPEINLNEDGVNDENQIN